MLQTVFTIPYFNIPIYGYGVMLVIGFLAAIQLASYLAKRVGLDADTFVNAGLVALIFGIAGARLSHVIENIGDFTRADRTVWQNLWAMINIRTGGLTYYGGFILSVPALIIYAKIKRLPVRLGMDIVAPCLMIGLGFGRIGCFLNGCCYGAVSNVPWAVHFPYFSIPYQEEFNRGTINPPAALVGTTRDGQPALRPPDELLHDTADLPPDAGVSAANVKQFIKSQRSLPLHPAQLYCSFTAFLIAGISLCYLTLPHAPGQVFALMLMIEGLTRYLLELVRVEPPVVGNFSLSMVLGLVLAATGIVLFFAFAAAARASGDDSAVPRGAALAT